MRTKRGEKEKRREKILVMALPALKISGRGEAPVDKIMQEVGMTSGALYSHFKSKDDLFLQALLMALDQVIENQRTQIQRDGRKALEGFVDRYLSTRHVTSVSEGCLFVALGADMHKQSVEARELFEKRLDSLFEVMAEGLEGGALDERKDKVRFVFSTMVGALTFARMMPSLDSADRSLKRVRQQLLELISKPV